MNRSTKVTLSVVAAAGLFVAGSATGAVAGKLVTGDQIAKQTITGRNIAPQSVGMHKLKPGLRVAIAEGEEGAVGPKGDKGEQGVQGAVGPKGDKGDKGDKGETGAAGTNGTPGVNDVSLAITDATTPGASQNSGYWVVPLPGDQLDGGSDSEVDLLTFDLTAGRYLVDVTAQFYSLNPAHPENYGVVTLYRGPDGGSATNIPGTLFTADLPDNPAADNAGQTNGSQIIEVTAPTTIYARGSFRTGDTSHQAVAGAQAVISRIG
ncbi:hypothetical protein [Nocardioides sp. LHG3406-4]|uniref:hypothetical protein n=1 Tax=Nocardioides sp. LHG3406-4 TaxID=2804575 RepID=UPI003CEF17AC